MGLVCGRRERERKEGIIGGTRRRERGRDGLFRRRRIDVCHVERSRDISRCYLPAGRSEGSVTFLQVKIISGGQTGVDRAALDAALKHRIDCGGLCPTGRLDEFGRIPDLYPVKELEQGSFAERTLQNVKDSEGTIVIYFNELRSGTEYTVQCCKQLQRPHKLINAANISPQEAAKLIVNFVRENKIDILNVAGPRQTQRPEESKHAFHPPSPFLPFI